jgi:Ribosome-associated heat shock protein implicated in the recycling of the 50S subunit (S4 paralog)
MRIDKFLKVTRLTKRRETAKELCDDGDIFINGKTAKAMLSQSGRLVSRVLILKTS